MARCNSCSAPLPSNVNRCRYCNVRNDIDLHSRHTYSISDNQSNRICPTCDKALQTVKLNLEKPLNIERCVSCFGLFFDLGEIDTLLKSSVSNVAEINLKLIKNINNDRYKKNQLVKYVKCPVCQVLMNRVNYGRHSGVVIDQCKQHGIWVDSGEITHLMEWKKAGGELLDAESKTSLRKEKKRHSLSNPPDSLKSYSQHNSLDIELMDIISTVVLKLFK